MDSVYDITEDNRNVSSPGKQTLNYTIRILVSCSVFEMIFSTSTQVRLSLNDLKLINFRAVYSKTTAVSQICVINSMVMQGSELHGTSVDIYILYIYNSHAPGSPIPC